MASPSPDRWAAELLVRALAGGASPATGQTLMRDDKGWVFGDPIPPLPTFHAETIAGSGDYTPNFATYRDYEFTITGTPIWIKNPTGIVEGESYFMRFLIGVDDLEIRWGDDDATTVFRFPQDGDGRLSKVSPKVDHVTFLARSTSILDGVIVKAIDKPAGLQ